MQKLSYKNSGVNIDVANNTKSGIAKVLDGQNKNVLNRVGAFATLYDGTFPGYKNPILVFKTEEPGTKQKLAIENNSLETIAYDLIGHLINDTVVMGAKPLSVQDCIVCGKMEKKVILKIVSSLAKACKENGCLLTGGETSEQPGVVPKGIYILTASITGVVEKDSIIDGSKIKEGDTVLALASNGLHTNGISLVRKIMEQNPKILKEKIGGKSFIENVLTPHRCYYNSLKGLFRNKELVGLAHITGGGIKENLNRILPKNLDAVIDVNKIRILKIFKTLKKFGKLEDEEMFRAFNMGVGIAAVVKKNFAGKAKKHLRKFGIDTYEIGKIIKGKGKVILK
ncbi:TPA: phosphoribosylformylglycinamidine cyclo-ligase [Candidatus Nomurabacteria bacterium]|uniref:Phosphoribosylformylglycinamidine cyclo-ligase n=2 Tax=Candidatus Nomuraibacteriota TaxID=1752729 RepID=A0A1F6YM45_9BACT|nr:MAG: Phosphoribosylformylglycinamidine cyclo-ligase [Parcubacteria group bacterium GW2011_GWC1_42_21]KKS58698.1 MAG: Phosphoribosylformylglycinamidine cyclo-ligase [Candidatus Nomurabacteria bacterium GW2011_GWF1_42_40]KKT07913.1 MAG: Phosphoribosylformylglycinamidine cyclo-ligase [Candidatus Nomurabacteria bacterium GW2011_GWB1_43_19]KKT11874.1 MAG: Phosphoribosylformylglycinamidine cyclo-ligase [Candidatus Nomurabacteria bacterium GW2011_GWF2_43_24]KKT18372.1 MAG: Phosphoribosylformylglyci